ncbi:MAG: hypothetical protein ACKV2Q_07775 [Planctomycetaceae bacterium]
MSRKMSSSMWPRLWIVWSLLFAGPLKAEPPKAVSGPAIDRTAAAHVECRAVIYEVDPAKLAKLAEKTKLPVAEFLRLNGFTVPKNNPNGVLVATVVREELLSFDLHGQNVDSAFKLLPPASFLVSVGHSATISCNQGTSSVGVISGGGQSFSKGSGTTLTVNPSLDSEGLLVLETHLQETRTDNGAVLAVPVRWEDSKREKLTTTLKPGKSLLMANGSGESSLTYLVRLEARVLTEVEIAALPKPAPAHVLTTEKVTSEYGPPSIQQIEIAAVIYEVDPIKLSKLADKTKSPVAELLKLNGFTPPKDAENPPAVVYSIREQPLSFDVGGQNVELAFQRRTSPTVAVLPGFEASVVGYGGAPIPIGREPGRDTEIAWRDIGTKLNARGTIEPDGRLLLDLRVEDSRTGEETGAEVNGVKIQSLRTRVMSLAAKLKSGQHLLIANGTSESDLTQFVQITPRLLTQNETTKRLLETIPSWALENIQPAASNTRRSPQSPAKHDTAHVSDDGTITVEDRWPIAEIKIGQPVIIVPVTIGKTSLTADVKLIMLAAEGSYSQRVTQIEPLPNQAARRVTVTVPAYENDDVQKTLNGFFDQVRSATTTCVIPVSAVSPTDIWDARLLHEIFDQIPAGSRPRPQEITVGESFTAIGIPGLLPRPEKVRHEIGPLHLELQDDHAGGFWRVSAMRTGKTRLIQLPMSGELPPPARITEYLVKADTRELEHHLQQSFPTAKVTITSVGANSLMLMGAAASEEDARGIVELAEQFAPKVLNRLKVGAEMGSRTRESSDRSLTTSATEPRAVRQANGIADESNSTGERGGVSPPVERDRAKDRGADAAPLAKSNVAEPQKVRVRKAAHDLPSKSAELQQLRDEIRELRQDVRELIQRLDREPAATLKKNEDAKPAFKLGGNDLEFNKLTLEFNELMEQQRFAEAEVIAKQAVELDPNNPLSQTMTLRATFARRVADNEKKRPATTIPGITAPNAGDPWGPVPQAHESVIANAWQTLGLRLAPLTESERTQLPSKFQGGMKVTEVRPDSPASQNKIRKDDILVGLHVWETTSFDNLQFVLGHPHVIQHGTLKFYVVRGTETLFGELKIVTPAMPMPSNIRIDPPRQPRSIALSDLPNKLVTEFDKLKLHIEVHQALIETALEARGITVTDDEARQFHQVHADRDQFPVELFLQAMQHTPMGQQFLQATRQQLALVKYSGQTTEPTEQELRDAYQLAQAGRVACRQLTFSDKAKAHEVARTLHANPERFEEIAAKHGQPPNAFPGRTLIPTVPPNPMDEVLAKLKDGEVSDVTQVGEQFVIYQRQPIVAPLGTFEQLKPQLRATLILNKTNEIGQREVEKLRKDYRLIVVPAHQPPKIAEPGASVPTRTKSVSSDVSENAPRLSEEEQRIMRQLGKTVIVEMKEPTPLREAIKQLARLGDFNVVLDQAGLEEESLKPTTPVTLQVRDVRLSTALRLLLEPLNLDFVVKHDVLQITNRQRAAGPLTIVAYPVPDLLDKDGDLSNLGDLLMSMIEPDSWETVGGPATVRGNVATQSLVIRQTQANHLRVRELLESLRKAGNQTTSTTPRQTSATDAKTKSASSPNNWPAVTEKRTGKYNPNHFDQQLATKVSVHFENAPLSKVIDHLSEVAKVNIVLDHDGLKDESLTPQTPVSLAVDQIQLRSALALLLEPLNLDFTQDADGLKVSSTQRIQGAHIVMTYSVADLVCPIEGLEIQLTKNGATTPQKKRIAEDVAAISFDELVKLIRSTVAPTSWSEVGGTGLIKAHPESLSLVIRQSRAVHDELRDLLEQLRRLQDLQVSFEVRILKFGEGFPGVGSSMPEGWNAAAAKKPIILTNADATALFKATNDTKRNNVVHAPKVTLSSGQRVLFATAADSELTPFRFTATNVVSADREFVRVSLAADAGSSNYSTTATVRDGQSLLINITETANNDAKTGIPILSNAPNVDRLFKNVSQPPLKPGESLFLLATPRVIAPEAEEQLLLGVPD